jgi:hypothetical protein
VRTAVRELWVVALLSGRFRQGVGKLTAVVDRSDGSTAEFHCCLGVLCELAVEAGVQVTVRDDGEPGHQLRSYDGQRNFPPRSVLEWAGLLERNPSVRYDDRVVTLGLLNDEAGASFELIAQLVEEQL